MFQIIYKFENTTDTGGIVNCEHNYQTTAADVANAMADIATIATAPTFNGWVGVRMPGGTVTGATDQTSMVSAIKTVPVL